MRRLSILTEISQAVCDLMCVQIEVGHSIAKIWRRMYAYMWLSSLLTHTIHHSVCTCYLSHPRKHKPQANHSRGEPVQIVIIILVLPQAFNRESALGFVLSGEFHEFASPHIWSMSGSPPPLPLQNKNTMHPFESPGGKSLLWLVWWL